MITHVDLPQTVAFHSVARDDHAEVAPWLQAERLEAARLARGARVLEIGSGGYTPRSSPKSSAQTASWSPPWVTERAAHFLAGTEYPQVKVVLGDAEHAADTYGPFDAILVTAGARGCPWGRLLVPEGRMVVPLRFATITRSITFVRDGERFQGLDALVMAWA